MTDGICEGYYRSFRGEIASSGQEPGLAMTAVVEWCRCREILFVCIASGTNDSTFLSRDKKVF